jgi:esterase/lipase superfamily enzyme
MSPITIFVTNRNINVGKARKKHLFGNKLSGDNKLHIARADQNDKEEEKYVGIRGKNRRKIKIIKKTYELNLVEPLDHMAYLQEVVANSDNGKPWVVFLHGNNQTLSKNLVKSRRIQDEYDVNMLIFSWPSCSYNPAFLPMLLAGIVVASNPPTALFGKWIQKKAFKAKIKQYREARRHAHRTAPHFAKAFDIMRDNLLLPMQESHNPHTSMLVHSLGHLVLRKTVDNYSDQIQGYRFNTCMLHQADEEDEMHQEWTKRIPFVDANKTYITRNVRDAVLFMSGVVNNDLNPLKACTRLGNRWDTDSEAGSPHNYIDFTGMDGLGFDGHGIAWEEGRSPEVDALCRPVLTGR